MNQKKEYQKKWRELHKNEQKLYHHQWYLKNKIRILQLRKKYEKVNSEEIKQKKHLHYLKNKDYFASQAKQYRLNNRVKIYQRQKEWGEKNRDRISKLRKQYCIDNAEKIRANNKKRYQKNKHNPEYILRRKEYGILNRQRISEHQKRYYRENNLYERNRNKYSINRHNRRALLKASGKLSLKDIQRLYEDNIKQYKTLTCYLCLKPIEFGQDSLEHKMPLSRGGSNTYENLGVAHLKCNLIKGNKTLKEFRADISFEKQLSKIGRDQAYEFERSKHKPARCK